MTRAGAYIHEHGHGTWLTARVELRCEAGAAFNAACIGSRRIHPGTRYFDTKDARTQARACYACATVEVATA